MGDCRSILSRQDRSTAHFCRVIVNPKLPMMKTISHLQSYGFINQIREVQFKLPLTEY